MRLASGHSEPPATSGRATAAAQPASAGSNASASHLVAGVVLDPTKPTLARETPEAALAGINRGIAKLLGDADELVVLGVAIGTAGQPVLIWPQLVATAISAMVESSVSPERCRARRCTRPHRQVHRGEGFAEGADLVHLYKDRVGGLGVDALLQDTLHVGDEKVVADELALVADHVGQLLSSRPSRARPCHPRSSGWGTSRPTWPSTRPSPRG